MNNHTSGGACVCAHTTDKQDRSNEESQVKGVPRERRTRLMVIWLSSFLFLFFPFIDSIACARSGSLSFKHGILLFFRQMMTKGMKKSDYGKGEFKLEKSLSQYQSWVTRAFQRIRSILIENQPMTSEPFPSLICSKGLFFLSLSLARLI